MSSSSEISVYLLCEAKSLPEKTPVSEASVLGWELKYTRRAVPVVCESMRRKHEHWSCMCSVSWASRNVHAAFLSFLRQFRLSWPGQAKPNTQKSSWLSGCGQLIELCSFQPADQRLFVVQLLWSKHRCSWCGIALHRLAECIPAAQEVCFSPLH